MSPSPEPEESRRIVENELKRQNAQLQSCIDHLMQQNKQIAEKEKQQQHQEQGIYHPPGVGSHLTPSQYSSGYGNHNLNNHSTHSNHANFNSINSGSGIGSNNNSNNNHSNHNRLGSSTHSNSHSRSNSHSGHSHQLSKSHSRRHSLAVSEARRAAHQRSNTPQNVNEFMLSSNSPSRTGSSPNSSGLTAPGVNSAGLNTNPKEEPSYAAMIGGDPGPIADLSLNANANTVHDSFNSNNSSNPGSSGGFGANNNATSAGGDHHLGTVPVIQYSNYSTPHSPSYHADANPEFKFPPSPQRKGHGRSHSLSSTHSSHRRTGSWRDANSGFYSNNFNNNNNFSNGNNGGNGNNGSNGGNGNNNQLNPSFLGHRSRHSDASDYGRSQSNTRRLLFVPYLSQAQIPEMVASGLLVTGVLRVDRKNRSHAYVSTPALDADVFIEGSRDRNRALDGDTVAVELLDVDDVWAQRQEKEERKRLRDGEFDPTREEPILDPSHGTLVFRPNQKRAHDTEIEGQQLFLSDEVVIKEDKPLYSGHIVAVLERPQGQCFTGTLGVLRPSSQASKDRQHQRQMSTPGFQNLTPSSKPSHSNNHSINNLNNGNNGNGNNSGDDRPKIVWFRPTDKHIPLIAIPTEQAPNELFANPAEYANQIYIAQIKRWPITSLHPFGFLGQNLGPCDSPEVVERAVSHDANFWSLEFTAPALSELDLVSAHLEARAATLPIVSDEVLILNDDLAISFRGDESKIAVHILDIVPSIQPNSALDRELRDRSVSVYSENITFPLFHRFEEPEAGLQFEVGKLSPVLTVEISLDGSPAKIRNEGVKPVLKDDKEKVMKYLNAANTFRKMRGFEPLSSTSNAMNLDLFLDINKISLDSITNPDLTLLITREIEHAVNMAVAAELLKCPTVGLDTIVRQQEVPVPSKFDHFTSYLRTNEIKVDTTNAATFTKSICKSRSKDLSGAVMISLFKILSQQKFTTVSGTNPGIGHYWFNVGAYTNVTRPLQRYTDHIAARQVHAILQTLEVPPPLNYSDCFELSFRHECAVKLQMQALHLHIARSLVEEGFKTCIGQVVNVQESSFDVVVSSLCLEKRVYCDQLNIDFCQFNAETNELDLKWEPDADQPDELKEATSKTELILKDGNIQTIKPFTNVVVQVHAACEGIIRPIISIIAVNPYHV